MSYPLQSVKFLPRASKRGSALLTAIIFSFVVALLMGSYLKLASTEYRISSRSYMMNGSFNLAEGGVELAMDALNRSDSSGWNAGSYSGDSYWARTYSGYDLGGGLQGVIEVVVVEPNSSPTIYSQGIITGSTVGGDMRRQITVTMDTGFFPWRNGVDSKSGIVLSGNNVEIDSYNSDDGAYGGSNINSNATVSTVSIEEDAADTGNAKIYGFVATGGSAPDVGPNGVISSDLNAADGTYEYDRVTTDYYAEFPYVGEPSDVNTYSVNTLPTSGLILPGNYLVTGDWAATGDVYITIGQVNIVFRGDMEIKGSKEFAVGNLAKMNIYIEGDMSIGGNGMLNGSSGTAKPERLQIYGTNTTAGGQSFDLGGNAQLSASVYAPNANVKINGAGGSGRVYGAVVGYDISFTGNAHFSYDEALSDFNLEDGGLVVDDWVEMNSVGLNTTPIDLSVYGL